MFSSLNASNICSYHPFGSYQTTGSIASLLLSAGFFKRWTILYVSYPF
ncbi:hypothetical protein CHCC14821_3848 [Bacillus paralicheniformis]|nr:hypothetical protein CHCC14821_3848 [Bacillus paralicheniformis]